MKLLVPCAGRSSRFPKMPPKWMLPDQQGVPMVVRAVEKLRVRPANMVFAFLAEHEARFRVRDGLVKAFGPEIGTVILDAPTRSQSETVVEMLRRVDADEPILVKDSDNTFALEEIDAPISYVTVASLNEFDQINPRNKSYVSVDHEDFITAIREKQVISEHFSVGGYFFRKASIFLEAYEELSAAPSETELYISEIISFLLLNGEIFRIRRARDYKDWGTVHEWRRNLESGRVFVMSLDGFLFQRGSSYFEPAFAAATPHPGAVEAARRLKAAGHKLIYLSIRPQALEPETRRAMEAAGLPEAPLLMETDATQWTLVTSADPSLPFRSGRAVEVAPDDENLIEKLIDLG